MEKGRMTPVSFHAPLLLEAITRKRLLPGKRFV
jgi:hypothetical protein